MGTAARIVGRTWVPRGKLRPQIGCVWGLATGGGVSPRIPSRKLRSFHCGHVSLAG